MSSTNNHLASPFTAHAVVIGISRSLVRLAAFLQRLWAAYWAYQVRRATVRMLRTLDDRTLKDIGLTRRKVDMAVRGFPCAVHWGGQKLRL